MDTNTRKKVCRRMRCCAGLHKNLRMIINILLINSDEPYFVCEVLEMRNFLLTSIVLLYKETVFCKPSSLSDYHTLGLYSLQRHETVTTHYIVLQYHLM